MKDLAGNELEVRWAKCEDLVPGTWCLDFYPHKKQVSEGGLGVFILSDGYYAVDTPGLKLPTFKESPVSTFKEYPIDDRYGPVLLGDKK